MLILLSCRCHCYFFFQAEDGIRDIGVTGVQTCALPISTPGAALLLRRYGFDMAAVVSASHNPYRDNGIKFFGPEGMKASDELEAEIERRLDEPSSRVGRVRELHGAAGDYLRELELRFAALELNGVREIGRAS